MNADQAKAFDAAFGPVFAAITTTPRLALYKHDLAHHDWTAGDWSDDAWVAQRGRDERRRLEAEAKVIDPDFSVWNSVAPAEYRKKVAA